MTENQISLSDDGMELTISSPSGQRATLRSARTDGFTPTDLENARTFPLNSNMVPGQVNQARRFRLGRRAVYVHVNTGPPTWWLPRLEIKRGKLMIGWLRVLLAVSWATT
jgi:hypothetical protein